MLLQLTRFLCLQMSDNEITSDVGDDADALSGNDTSVVLSESESMTGADSDSDVSVEWKNMSHDESAWKRLIVDAIDYTPEFSVKLEKYQAAGENAKRLISLPTETLNLLLLEL